MGVILEYIDVGGLHARVILGLNIYIINISEPNNA